MSTTAQPNVIILITDDQGYGDMGCHGNPVATTPEMDRLHDQSIRFTNFHAAPMCTPTRGQLLTGIDAARNGAVNVSSGRTLLRADIPTMADVFREHGYRTGLFGKWHLGDNYPFRPQDRGFEESLWFPSSHISSLPDYWENDYFDDVYCRNGKRERYEGYCTDVFFREAIGWIEDRANKGEPFLAYLPTNAPHYPLFVPAEDRELAERAFAAGGHLLPDLADTDRENIIRFLAMIHNVDTHIGVLKQRLSDLNVLENTILIFMTDNGSTFGPQYYNAGMRGGKCTLWEGGHRVPCFIHWPAAAMGPPRDVEGLTQVQDILPTLMDLCNLPAATDLDGMSLAPVLRGTGEIPEDRMLFINYSRMPSTDYPTPDSLSVMAEHGAAVLWKNWRLVEDEELFDLNTDPEQEVNVLKQHPDIAASMRAGLAAWWRGVETKANEFQRVIIGSEEENPMMLSACEWADVFVDQQKQVRFAALKNSYWHLEVAQPGAYRFELRRWPAESDLGIGQACPAAQFTDGSADEGLALPITQARIMIGGRQLVQKVSPDDRSATFTLDLEKGPTLLHTWFDDERKQPLCGAYYVYVEAE